jgi:hypothetical protein
VTGAAWSGLANAPAIDAWPALVPVLLACRRFLDQSVSNFLRLVKRRDLAIGLHDILV